MAAISPSLVFIIVLLLLLMAVGVVIGVLTLPVTHLTII
jgi:hypothetical protein